VRAAHILRRPYFCEKLLNVRMEIVEYVTSDIVFAAEELRLAASALGRITGKVDVEQVLDALFSTFCIGK
jgi:tRNA modification GTPase